MKKLYIISEIVLLNLNFMIKFLKNLTTNKIFLSSSGLIGITLLVKMFGYVEKLLLANYFGTSYIVDSYTVVLTIVLSLFLFFREIIEPGFLNVFLDVRSNGNEVVSWDLFNQGLRIILFIALIISILSYFFPKEFITVFAPGFDGEQLELSKLLIKIAVPACIFLSLSTITSITLNGLKIFVLPASGELVFKGLIIICLVLFFKKHGITGAAIGILIGSVGRLGIHLTKLYKKISFKKIRIESKYKQRVWKLTWPLLIGVGFSQISSIVDNIFASYLQEGAIAALSYAKKITELPVVIFPYVISIVVFPYFSQLAIEKNKERIKKMLTNYLMWVTIAFIPIASFFYIYSNSIVEIIFQRGAFDAYSTLLTSKPLMIYSLGMVFFAIETILVIFYYANADTRTPVFVGIGCVILNIFLTWGFIHFIGYLGIALAFVIQKVVKNIILLYLLKYKISFSQKNVAIFIFKLMFSFIPFIVFIVVSKLFLFETVSRVLLMKIGFLLLNFLIGGTLYLFILSKFGLFSIKGANRVELK